ncbi:MAG: type II secretion system protein, partial [Planctomycetota bacterium]
MFFPPVMARNPSGSTRGGDVTSFLSKRDCMRRCKSKAFTLIELLVVISIIAVLLSVIVPSLNRAKDAAKKVLCRSNLKNISYASF